MARSVASSSSVSVTSAASALALDLFGRAGAGNGAGIRRVGDGEGEGDLGHATAFAGHWTQDFGGGSSFLEALLRVAGVPAGPRGDR